MKSSLPHTTRFTPESEREIGLMVKHLRLSKGMRQEDLALKAGMHRSLISHIETGLPQRLGSKTIRRLAEALEVPEEWFVRISKGNYGKHKPTFLDRDVRKMLRIIPVHGESKLSSLLAKVRLDNLMSQTDLAREFGIDQTIIQQLERGTLERLELDVLISLLGALNTPFSYLGEEVEERLNEFEQVSPEELHERHKAICLRFRVTRRSMGVRLAELARRVNRDKGNISKLERAYSAKTTLWGSTIGMLTEGLGLDREWFDQEYREHIAATDTGSWLCPDCLSIWSRYRITCTCKDPNV